MQPEGHEPGPGSPSERQLRERIAQLQASEEHQGPTTPAVVRRRILVVDDNLDLAQSMVMLLRLSRHEVQMAHDGPGALVAAKEFRPDVILLDIGLPGMSGYDVARQLRAMPEFRRVQLVALTGYGHEDDRRRSREAGFDDHLVKPVQRGDLEKLLAGMPQH
jgi:CheY-like chemotaxis protein